jgi:hypothetical protein
MPDEGLAEDFLHVADLVQTRWHYERKPEEKHSTIYHPAALKALRAVFDPHRGKGQVMRKGR